MAKRKAAHAKLSVAVVTGTRAEFGLLTPVMRAIEKHPALRLQVVAAGAHMLPPARTIRDVEAAFDIAARVPMQRPGKTGRVADAIALGRGVEGFAKAFAKLKPDWVVVLGDRIEAFAAASAASIAGIAVCHIHGGDRAEGIADEAMRHAITKLSHLHCAATKQSAQRIIKLGEPRKFVHVTGSPAIDGLSDVPVMNDEHAQILGDPQGIILLHPWGGTREETRHIASEVALACSIGLSDNDDDAILAIDGRVLWLAPNHDAGRDDIVLEMNEWCGGGQFVSCDHLPRVTLISLFKRLRARRGVLIGNSSAGLIEAAAIGLAVVNVGERQSGREQAGNVQNVPTLPTNDDLDDRLIEAIEKASKSRVRPSDAFGDGRAGPRIAQLLAKFDPHEPAMLRKRIVY